MLINNRCHHKGEGGLSEAGGEGKISRAMWALSI